MKPYIVVLSELLRPLEAEIHNKASRINRPPLEARNSERVVATCQRVIG